jgi:hypothetical protein
MSTCFRQAFGAESRPCTTSEGSESGSVVIPRASSIDGIAAPMKTDGGKSTAPSSSPSSAPASSSETEPESKGEPISQGMPSDMAPSTTFDDISLHQGPSAKGSGMRAGLNVVDAVLGVTHRVEWGESRSRVRPPPPLILPRGCRYSDTSGSPHEDSMHHSLKIPVSSAAAIAACRAS